MSASKRTPASGGPRSGSAPTGRRPIEPRPRRQFFLITAAAVGVFAALRLLPTGTGLSHMDFRVDPKNTNAIEFCDPLNPQFIPVVAARSPVTMTITTNEPPRAGSAVRAVLRLQTGSGKPIAPEDLLVTHTRRLHVLVVDPTLTDYQHVHPEPTRTPGEWAFSFAPRAAGMYRIFGDFTPAATARGLYASVDLAVGGPPGGAPAGAAAWAHSAGPVERDGVVFTLTAAPTPSRAGQPIDLRFTAARADGGTVALEPVMGAFAHLVAFDEARSGFAHLHPVETDLAKPPDATKPALNFKLTIPRAGSYVVWAQVNLAGREVFVPFDFPVRD